MVFNGSTKCGPAQKYTLKAHKKGMVNYKNKGSDKYKRNSKLYRKQKSQPLQQHRQWTQEVNKTFPDQKL